MIFYELLKYAASIFFNILNFLLGGNLPPFGSVCVIVKDKNRYLLLKRPSGEYVLPGGFMRWRERPQETARRETREETGLEVQPTRVISYESYTSKQIYRMSSIVLAYHAQFIGGTLLQGTVEGTPEWVSVEDLSRLSWMYKKIIQEYLHQFPHHEQINAE